MKRATPNHSSSRTIRRLAYGVGIAVASYGVFAGFDALFVEEGRGAAITACPSDYDGSVVVTNTAVLKRLGESATRLNIKDPAANQLGFSVDMANLPGELACKAVVNYGSGETEVVLLPAGMEVLDRSSSYAQIPGHSYLPDGLSWRHSQ